MSVALVLGSGAALADGATDIFEKINS